MTALLLQILDYMSQLPGEPPNPIPIRPGDPPWKPSEADRVPVVNWLRWFVSEPKATRPSSTDRPFYRLPTQPVLAPWYSATIRGEVVSGLLDACSSYAAAGRQLQRWRRKPPSLQDPDAAMSAVREIHKKAEDFAGVLNEAKRSARRIALDLLSPEEYERWWHSTMREKVAEARSRARFVRQCPSCGQLFAVRRAAMTCGDRKCTNQQNYLGRKLRSTKQVAKQGRAPGALGSLPQQDPREEFSERDILDLVQLVVAKHGRGATQEALEEMARRIRASGWL